MRMKEMCHDDELRAARFDGKLRPYAFRACEPGGDAPVRRPLPGMDLPRTQAGAEYVALNPTRADKRLGSFRINLGTGRWADFATGDAGGDPVSLYAYLHDLRQIDAARRLAVRLGVQS
jgi:hypothetical protein